MPYAVERLLVTLLASWALREVAAAKLREKRSHEGRRKVEPGALGEATVPTKLPDGWLAEGEECYDKLAEWTDLEGDSCQVYADGDFCTRQDGIRFGLKTVESGIDANFINNDTATEICCWCGGGIVKMCDAACQAIRAQEVAEVKEQFNEAVQATSQEIAEAGAAAVSQAAVETNAASSSAMSEIKSDSQLQTSQAFEQEELAFSQLTFGSNSMAQLAGMDLGTLGATTAQLQISQGLALMDSGKLNEMANQVHSKFGEAHSAWESNRDDALAALFAGNSKGQEASDAITKAVRDSSKASDDLENLSHELVGVGEEARAVEQEAELAADLSEEVADEATGVEERVEMAENNLNKEMTMNCSCLESELAVQTIHEEESKLERLKADIAVVAVADANASTVETPSVTQADVDAQQAAVESAKKAAITAELHCIEANNTHVPTVADVAHEEQELQQETKQLETLNASTETAEEIEQQLEEIAGPSPPSPAVVHAEEAVEAVQEQVEEAVAAPAPPPVVPEERATDAEIQHEIEELQEQKTVAQAEIVAAEEAVVKSELKATEERAKLEEEVKSATPEEVPALQNELNEVRIEAANEQAAALQDELNAVQREQVIESQISSLEQELNASTASTASAAGRVDPWHRRRRAVSMDMSLEELVQANEDQIAELDTEVAVLEEA
eukprot:gb/GFBE01018054.1/.p1 GENE.gb/GFBE01018054.1/~~gb/GFBE01018054.1/.p1  ORF type:complete len:677 (+),score=233.94 gb/GFBE01018054.1/:1-2031(+)